MTENSFVIKLIDLLKKVRNYAALVKKQSGKFTCRGQKLNYQTSSMIVQVVLWFVDG